MNFLRTNLFVYVTFILVFATFTTNSFASISLKGGKVGVGKRYSMPLKSLVNGYYFTITCDVDFEKVADSDIAYLAAYSNSYLDNNDFNSFSGVNLNDEPIGVYDEAHGIIKQEHNQLKIFGVYKQMKPILFTNEPQSDGAYTLKHCQATLDF